MKIYKIACLLVFVLVITPCFLVNNVEAKTPQLSQTEDSQIKASRNSFPEKFDLRDCDLDGTGEHKNYITSVKMQDPYGTCWAHGGICAAESSILSMQRKNSWFVDEDGKKHDSIDLSEHHLTWFNYSPLEASETTTQVGEGANSTREEKAKIDGEPNWHTLRMHTGGEIMSTIGMLAKGSGPVEEQSYAHPDKDPSLRYVGAKGLTMKNDRGETCYSWDDDWALDNSLRFKQDYELEEAMILPDYSKVDTDDNLDLEHAKYVSGLIKDQLMQGHALSVSHDYDPYTPDQTVFKQKYLNVDTWAQYSYKSGPPGHCVTLVGWDDNYSKDNFLKSIPDEKGGTIEVPQPPGNGAWILKNSHGAMDSIAQGITQSHWGINDSGYYYLSYYDKSLKNLAAYKFNLKDNNKKIIHQNDYMSREETFSLEKDTPMKAANVFCANTDEELCELSFMTTRANETVTYNVYLLDSSSQPIEQGKLLCTKTESYPYKGFHRIHLDKKYKLSKGQYFAVVASEQCDGKYVLGLSGDYNHEGHEKGLCNDNYWCHGVVNPGESFIYDGEWKDFSTVKQEWEQADKYKTYDNFPIKAFADHVAVQETNPTAKTGDSCLLLGLLFVLVVLSINIFVYKK
ncbi:MAG: lectin like domain-containing protein [Coriobacteriia bacterium]|nr:lectin like domain-containing protein [Coriobacteriia bacterium]